MQKERLQRYLLDPRLGDMSPAEIRERVETAAASHLLWNITCEPQKDGIPKVRHSITKDEAWNIALSTQYWSRANFEIYMQELVDAGFLRPVEA